MTLFMLAEAFIAILYKMFNIKKKLMTIVFGTDGWRGVIAKDFTFDNVRLVAYATAKYIKKRI